MIDQYVSLPAVKQRYYVGPLGKHIDAFAELLSKQGYAKGTGGEKLRLVSALSRWLQQKKYIVSDLNEQRLHRFLKCLQKCGRVPDGAMRTLQSLLMQLREHGIIPIPASKKKDSKLYRIEKDYARYLSQERGLAQVTISDYVLTVRRFLSECFNSRAIRLNTLHSQDIIQFIHQQSHTVSPKSVQRIVTALRSFLRYVHVNGKTRTSLADCIPPIANWRLSQIPKYLEPEQIICLLQSCDRNTPSGIRDYAILLLLARLGLRATEVVHMELNDLNWEKGDLIVRGKGNRYDQLPIPHDVGDALVAYLLFVRPHCPSRRVFIRQPAPHQGFSSSVAICDILRRALVRANLHLKRKGAHLFRHSLAKRMLDEGSSLSEIGQILRHRSPGTTEIYVKVDQSKLKELAQPWPGGEL